MITLYTDGGSRSNPGIAGIGVYAEEGGSVLFEVSEYLGVQTNNYAEYTAVIRALEECVARGYTEKPLQFKLDSKLVVEQVQGNWKVKEETLKPLVARVRALTTHFPSVSFTHIPRAQNANADRLANMAMDQTSE